MIYNRLITYESPIEFVKTDTFDILVSELSGLDILSLSNFEMTDSLITHATIFLIRLQDELLVWGDDKLVVDVLTVSESNCLQSIVFKINYAEKRMPLINHTISKFDKTSISMDELFKNIFSYKYFCSTPLCQQSMVNLNYILKLFDIKYNNEILLGINTLKMIGSYVFNTYNDKDNSHIICISHRFIMLSIYIRGNSITISLPPIDSNSNTEIYTFNEISDNYDVFCDNIIKTFEFHYEEKITNLSDFILVREMERL